MRMKTARVLTVLRFLDIRRWMGSGRSLLMYIVQFQSFSHLLVWIIWLKSQNRELQGWRVVFLSLGTVLKLFIVTIKVILFFLINVASVQETTAKNYPRKGGEGRMTQLKPNYVLTNHAKDFCLAFLVFAW